VKVAPIYKYVRACDRRIGARVMISFKKRIALRVFCLTAVVSLLAAPVGLSERAFAQSAGACRSPGSTSPAGFRAWLTSGGAERAGLQRQSLNALGQLTDALLTDVALLCQGVYDVNSMWAESAGRGNLPLVTVTKISSQLKRLAGQTAGTMAVAAESKSLVAQTLSTVNAKIAEDERRLGDLRTQQEQADRRMNDARAALQQAQNELNGNKGFWNGIATGITFGIYNPLKENVDRANAAIAAIRSEQAAIQTQQQSIGQADQEVAGKRALIERLATMDGTITAFQNTVHTASKSVDAAADHLSSANDARSPAVIALFLRRTNEDMAALTAWIGKFNDVVRQYAVIPAPSDPLLVLYLNNTNSKGTRT
jgi:hypothetical protein